MFHPWRWRKLIERHHRTRPDLVNVSLNAKLKQHGFQQARILSERLFIDRAHSRLWFRQHRQFGKAKAIGCDKFKCRLIFPNLAARGL